VFFSIVSDESAAFVNFLQISHGSLFVRIQWKSKALDEPDEIIRVSDNRTQRTFSVCLGSIVPLEVEVGENIKVAVPGGRRNKY
jgi:excinuclease ABC subunit C